MSLYTSINLAANSLLAQQVGMQVVGQNIANANTPGYSRAQALFTPAPTQRLGPLLLGMGVQVEGVVQQIDELLNERLRHASSDRSGSEAEAGVYAQLEGILGELSDSDLSSALTRFFGAVSEILNQPESVTVRNLAVLEGQTLAGEVSRLYARVAELRSDLNRQVTSMSSDINRLLARVAELNIQITATEGGGSGGSDAIGLRDQRNQALADLAELIEIRVDEQPSGAANVFVGGDYLVFDGLHRQVEVSLETDRGLSLATIRLVDTRSELAVAGGELAGLTSARDEVLGTFLDDLDSLARTLAFEFNKIYSSGQGLVGFSSLTSEFGALETNVALDAAGLPYAPVNGSLRVLVQNSQTGLTNGTELRIDLNGLDNDDTTLAQLVASLDAIDGLSASINSTGQVLLAAESPNIRFAFADDTSGVLAALGINTFFSGSSATNLGVSQTVRNDPGLFAASRTGIGADTDNAVELAGFLDKPLDAAGGISLTVLYERLVGGVAQGASVAKAVSEGFAVFEETLIGQQLAVSGVSLDEEAVRLMGFQRAYQASARFITTLNELLDVLVNL